MTTATTTRLSPQTVLSDTILSRPHLRRVFLINHIAKERKSLLMRNGHRDTGQFDLRLRFRQGEEVRLYFIKEHAFFHGIRVHHLTFSFVVHIKCMRQTLFELGPPHVRRFLASIEEVFDYFVLRQKSTRCKVCSRTVQSANFLLC